ncbi:MAG TPA: 1,2-phenylacetyl-CoA epoxidase subunit PaaC [Actinomycetales bacterium]|nr:1,2-phenylacetyl-CoA epoxidase subunit PaaC [Actinomycetales bacterium]
MNATARYCLGLGDDALVLAHRLGEWLSRAPQIEEDMALGNIGLDLLGQARTLLTHAGELSGGRSEDDLAYLRDEREFRCVHLVQLPRGDFGDTVARQLVFSTYQLALYSRLVESTDPVISALASKAVKEVTYHRDHAVQWTLRLGDGTAESHRRMQASLDAVWPYADELFTDDDVSVAVAADGVGVLPSSLRGECEQVWADVLTRATLELPEPRSHARGGRDGRHSEHLGYLLAEMQHIARSHPGATW